MDATPDAMIRLDAVSKRYPDGTVAVHELSLDVAEGEVCVLVGPSGCGKTTTMRMVNRLVEPTGGRVVLAGQDVSDVDPVQLRRGIGYVIQQVGLFPHQTVRRNVATVCSLLGWDRRRTAERVDELLDLVGLDPATYGDRYPSQLSGGQRQRVGVARALAGDPPVLLMDEPFGAVDPIARDRLQEEFLRLQDTVRKTVVFVTHDIDEAVRLGDRIAVMRQGGHLEQYATPAEILAAPATDFVADFVGSDRLVKLLAVTALDVADLTPAGARSPSGVADPAEVADPAGVDGSAQLADPTGAAGSAGMPTVGASSTLRDALAVLLAAPDGRAAVLPDGGGDPVGVLGMDDVRRMLRDAAPSQP